MSIQTENTGDAKIKSLLEESGFVYQPQNYGGIGLHGVTAGAYAVYVFEYWKFDNAGVDLPLLGELDSLLAEFKGELGERLYVVAPRDRIAMLLPPGDCWKMPNFEFHFHPVTAAAGEEKKREEK